MFAIDQNSSKKKEFIRCKTVFDNFVENRNN